MGRMLGRMLGCDMEKCDYFQISEFLNGLSDDDFLPDPDRPFRTTEKKPPDKPANQARGKKRKLAEDSTKGKCLFIIFCKKVKSKV